MKHSLILFILVSLLSCNNAANSTENCLPEEKEKSLVALGQLWGFLKYHHPTITGGSFDWDAELIKIIPDVMNAQNEEEWKNILDNWIDNFPITASARKDTIPWSRVVVKADYGELFNEAYFNRKTIDKLQYILDSTQVIENHFIKLNYNRTADDPFVTITNEPTYEEMAFPELSYRILALFRYWNIVNYFFPYRELCDTKWSEVLPEMLPEFICVENQKEYSLACMRLCAKIDDSHGYVHFKDPKMFYEIYGQRRAPFDAEFIENKLVVMSFLSDSVGLENEISVGDIITGINGEKIEDIVEQLIPFTAASNYEVKLREISKRILLTNDAVLSLSLLQNEKPVNKAIQTYDMQQLRRPIYGNPKPKEAGYSIIQDSIGYILPANCKREEREEEVARIMSNTKGLIIDLRRYPSDYNATSIAPYLMKNGGYFSRRSYSYISIPGYFLLTPNFLQATDEIGNYPYNVVVIVNEHTQSSGEDHTFFYYLAPRVTIIGSTTAAANGAVFLFPLPGGIITYMTGLGVYYPDGTCMQRLGVKIDEEIKPTIDGIKKGKDEPLDRAIEIVTGGK